MAQTGDERIRHEGCRACGEDLARMPEVPCNRCGWRYHAECKVGGGCLNPICADPLYSESSCLPAIPQGHRTPAVIAPKASCPRRLTAVLMDLGLAVSTSLAFATPVAVLGASQATVVTLFGLVMFSTALINEVVLTGLRGASVGKRAVGIQVTTSDGGPPGLLRAFVREIAGKYLSSCFYGLGFMIATVDPETRALHDRLAGTWVVEADGPAA